MNRRLGRITVSRALIDNIVEGRAGHDVAAVWSAMFGKLIVIEAVHRYDQHDIEYLAYSEEFEEWPEHISAPRYDAVISLHEGFVGAERVVTFDAKFTRIP